MDIQCHQEYTKSLIYDMNLIVKSFLPNEVKVINTIDAIKLRSNLATEKTVKCIEKSSLYTVLGFTQSHSGPLGDIQGFD